MNLARKIAAPPAIAVADTPLDLSAIHNPDCAATIWRREPLASFQSWIDALTPEELPKARLMLRPHAVRQAAAHVCDICGTPDCPERALLVDDVAALADLFAGVMDAPYLWMRLDVVTTNACRKFHSDAVTARLICTYRGTGTQYGIAGQGTEPENAVTVPTGAPILMRGTLWPEQPRAGLLHRSPPIEGTGETRLVLILDPVANPEEHPQRHLMH